MNIRLIKVRYAFAIAIVCCGVSNGQSSSKPDFQEVLGWFPADTNAITVANGPFPLTDLHDLETLLQNDEGPPEVFSDEQLREVFEIPALAPLVKYRTGLTKRLLGERVLLAAAGFRAGAPERSESCAVLVFESESIQDKLQSADAGQPLIPDDIDGHGLVVFEDRPEQAGAPSLIVAQPRPNVLIISESLSYVKAVLARACGKQGKRALPDTLPEWRHVDTHAAFWALGHHRRRVSKAASSRSTHQKSDSESDDVWEHVYGATISFNPMNRTGKMISLSADAHFFQKIQKENSGDAGNVEDQDSANTSYREIEPGVVEMKTVLASRSTTSNFVVYGVWFLVELSCERDELP